MVEQILTATAAFRLRLRLLVDREPPGLVEG
jgi:hypothetical protein